VGDPIPAGLDQRLSIEAALARLPEDQQLAVGLVLVEGLAYAEAADIAGVSVGTLTRRLARGRMRLVELLGETEGQT
jgi:RNA polymerase sigma-70 factor (ECF subfamily)